MSFMKLRCEHMQAFRVETSAGTEIVPTDCFLLTKTPHVEDFEDFCEGKPESFELVEGWFAWYSAPGYMDRTDYLGPFATESEAIAECKDLYGEEDEP